VISLPSTPITTSPSWTMTSSCRPTQIVGTEYPAEPEPDRLQTVDLAELAAAEGRPQGGQWSHQWELLLQTRGRDRLDLAMDPTVHLQAPDPSLTVG
jgi:hypothetical protein